MNSLKQLKKLSTKDAVIQELQDYIVTNNLKEGDPLPSEHELVSKLGISRNILREALQYFRTLGIIDSRPKTGAYIKQLTPENPFEGFIPYFSSDKNKQSEIDQLRQIIEIGAVPFIIEEVTLKQIKTLRELANGIKSSDLESRKQLDIEFHSTLIGICKNEILNSLKPLLIDYFENLPQERTSKKIDLIYKEHVAIVEALEQRDRAALRQAILEHYKFNK